MKGRECCDISKLLISINVISTHQLPDVPMTNKRITIHDLLNDEAGETKQQQTSAPSASDKVAQIGSDHASSSAVTNSVQPGQNKYNPPQHGSASSYYNANVYSNDSVKNNDSITNNNTSNNNVTVNTTPLSSIPRNYSFGNTGVTKSSSMTTLPSTKRLLSNTISGSSGSSGPILPLHLPTANSQPPQLPHFQLKSELNTGISGFSPPSSMDRTATSLPSIGGIQGPGVLQPIISPLSTSPKIALNHVSKPPFSMHTHRPHPLAAPIQEHGQNLINSSTVSVSRGTVSPQPGGTASPLATGSNLQYKINKPQGRPIIQSIIGKFTLYANIQDLILDITRFDRIRLRDVFNESLGPFELIRYSKEDLQLHHHNQNGTTGRATPDSPSSSHSNVSIQKNLVINEAQVYDKLRQEFQCKYLKFIKIIRDKKGKLLRLESVIIPNTNEITIDFIKKKICYPRYKSDMKIYLIKCDSPNEFQNKFIYIHDSHNLEDGKKLVNIDDLDKGLEQFKNLTIWCRNE